ncbi:MAG: 3-hydroxyacyl-CoA dehydrogenase [Verrucomicrobia bacterium]|nr:3-hydroxyacyl-CoA dehydrogenase [Verrucomicrobiota bacterium]
MSNFFKLEPLTDGVVKLVFDVPGQRVNTFSAAALEELGRHAADLAKRTDITGLLIASGKPGQFIAGADLNELAAVATATREEVTQAIERGHRLFSAMEKLPFPTVALIDGACMGGGTELVLSLDYRLVVAGPRTKVALPEVKIGLIPGWGGTQRLPRLVGVDASIEIITSGEPMDARRAVEIGFAFDAVPAERLVEEGLHLIAEARRTGEWKESRLRRSQPLGLSEDQARFAFALAEGAVRGKTKGQYPAPLIALKAMRDGINRPLDEGLQVEREASLEVFGTPIAANLIGQFFTNTRLQRETGVDDASIKPIEVKSIGVLGAGLMGAGIATAHARRGVRAAMVDVDDARVADGLKRARKVVEDRIAIGRAKPADLADMLMQLHAGTSRTMFNDCDVIVEAVTENEALKTKIIRELAGVARPDAILATNTSTISITRLAQAWPAPERLVGMHFFSPVDRMNLVEVVRGEKTSDETVATIVALAKRIGKTPIVVRDCPGFLVNRILMPYMTEALVMLGEGVDMDRIDKAAVKWGMPVGPIALHDMVGLDTALFAGAVLLAGYKDRAVNTPLLDDLVKLGRLGKKNGKGFRAYDKKGKPVADPEMQSLIAGRVQNPRELSDADIADRLFLCMALEAVRALDENIARQAGDVDMAMVLGCGFPAFRGGPLRWCDTEGAPSLLAKVAKWESLGARFKAPARLVDAAKTGARFFPQPRSQTVSGGKI